jgi:hypothetical protein
MTRSSLLEDFAVYMRSRPRDAVQRPVRRLIAAAYQHSFDDKSWPGSSLPRAAFRPKCVHQGKYLSLRVPVWVTRFAPL